MKRTCIVSLGTNDFTRARTRLANSMRNPINWSGDFHLFTEESQVGSPMHQDNPYAFKIYAIEEMKNRGYNQVLWVDCSVWAIKSVVPVFDLISQDGYVCQDAGHMVGRWTNDRTLNYFGITRDEAMQMPMYGNAGFLGLDFDTEIANTFFNQWKQSMLDGMFIGEWTNNNKTESQDPRCDGHRHDMSCGSIIRYKLGMKMQSGMDYLQYYYDWNPQPHNDSVCLFAAGMRG
jgi:hypothetical protein